MTPTRETGGDVKLAITFGAMAPPIISQLSHQGMEIRSGQVGHIQKDADALARLSARGVLSEKETHNARRRLMKIILKYATKAKP